MSAYRTQAARISSRRARLLTGCALAATLGTPALGQTGFKANPVVVSGSVDYQPGQVVGSGLRDTVNIGSTQTVIDWTPQDTGIGGGARMVGR